MPEPATSLVVSLPLTREALISAQRGDPFLARCFAAVVEDTSGCSEKQSFVENHFLLMVMCVTTRFPQAIPL